MTRKTSCEIFEYKINTMSLSVYMLSEGPALKHRYYKPKFIL